MDKLYARLSNSKVSGKKDLQYNFIHNLYDVLRNTLAISELQRPNPLRSEDKTKFKQASLIGSIVSFSIRFLLNGEQMPVTVG